MLLEGQSRMQGTLVEGPHASASVEQPQPPSALHKWPASLPRTHASLLSESAPILYL